MAREVRGLNAGSCSTIISWAKPQALSKILVIWLYKHRGAYQERQQMPAFYTHAVNFRVNNSCLPQSFCLHSVFPLPQLKLLSRCQILWDNPQMPGRSTGGKKIEERRQDEGRLEARGYSLHTQTVSLIRAPLNTLSPDVLNTWCTDRDKGREQSIRKEEDWTRDKSKHNVRRDSEESRAGN